MPKVYIVTSGCYSDYGIDKVFLNRENAEKYLSACDMNYFNDIEVYDTDDDLEYDKFIRADVEYKFTFNCDTGAPSVMFTPIYPVKGENYSFRNKTSVTKEKTLPFVQPTFTLNFSRIFRSVLFNEKTQKERMIKTAYDIATIIKLKLAEGFDVDAINILIGETKINYVGDME